MVAVAVTDELGQPTGEMKMVGEREFYSGKMPAASGKAKDSPKQDHTAAAATVPLDFCKSLGLEFLTDPPSLPQKSVQLQLRGLVRFSTVIKCHDVVVSGQFAVLVVDTRVLPEAIDLSLEDANADVTLITETELIPVHPPVPSIMYYDVGVLRHFLFIRKQEEET
jgi:hypothetical protein